MSTQLQKVSNHLQLQNQNQALSLQEIFSLGDVFAKSGFFSDTQSANQAIVKILAGQELGIAPFTAMKEISIHQGKLGFSAHLVAVLIKRSNRYSFKITQLDNQKCSIDFYEYGEKIDNSNFTIQDAQLAGLINKDVWKKYPRNLLFARALTNGARWYCPEVFNGSVYTPEELGASVDEEGNIIDIPKPITELEQPSPNLRVVPISEQSEAKISIIASLRKMETRILELGGSSSSDGLFETYSVSELKLLAKTYAKTLKDLLVTSYDNLLASLGEGEEQPTRPLLEEMSLPEINAVYEAFKASIS